MVVMPPREHDLAAENEALRKDIEILQHEVEVLSAKVAELEARLGQNSRSSSLPPSSDSPKSRAERRAAQREAAKAKGAEAKRARGKQPGAPGATLERRSDPDEVVVHEPERCDSCGNDLTNAPPEGVTSRQVYDIRATHHPKGRFRRSEACTSIHIRIKSVDPGWLCIRVPCITHASRPGTPAAAGGQPPGCPRIGTGQFGGTHKVGVLQLLKCATRLESRGSLLTSSPHRHLATVKVSFAEVEPLKFELPP
jgi:hypothetical protein